MKPVWAVLFPVAITLAPPGPRSLPAKSPEPVATTYSRHALALHSSVTTATETLAQVRRTIEQRVGKISSMTCTVEMSKAREDKPTRKIYSGPLEIARRHGGRLRLTRKGTTEEYIANSRIIWAYDHKHKEAQFIPASTPVVGTFVEEALKLNVFMSVDEDTLELLGQGPVEGEECWLLGGKSPRKLKVAGIPVSTIFVWVSKSDGLPRQIRIPEEKDTLILMRGHVINGPVDPRRFQWTPPKGVKQKNIFGF